MDAVLDVQGVPSVPSVAAGARGPLRFLTAGSVDDGKSTLIGRLLLDGQALLADQLDALGTHATPSGSAVELDLALATDGLEAEREQGITIDVAHRYFATPARKFIVADAPGHEQYTRNMVTAAAGSDAAVVLVDALRLRPGADGRLALLPQTRRHALVARLVGVPHLVFCINKLDAAEDPAAAFEGARDAVEAFAAAAGFVPAAIVPISALRGDNVARRSAFVRGYAGPALLELLESLPSVDEAEADAGTGAASEGTMPVQLVVGALGRADAADPAERVRVLWGRVGRGRLRVGATVQVLPSGERAAIAELHASGGAVEAVVAGRSAGVVLDRQLDVSRGDWLAVGEGAPAPTTSFAATVAWLDVEPATVGRRQWLRHGNRWVQGRIVAIESRLDIATLVREPADRLLANDIGSVVVETQEPLLVEPFSRDRTGGTLLLVDATTLRTAAVLLVAG